MEFIKKVFAFIYYINSTRVENFLLFFDVDHFLSTDSSTWLVIVYLPHTKKIRAVRQSDFQIYWRDNLPIFEEIRNLSKLWGNDYTILRCGCHRDNTANKMHCSSVEFGLRQKNSRNQTSSIYVGARTETDRRWRIEIEWKRQMLSIRWSTNDLHRLRPHELVRFCVIPWFHPHANLT